MLGEKELVFLLGDTQGNLSLVDENGLVIDKVKAIDGPIRGIKSFMVNRTRKVLVYGGKYSAILKCPRKIHET